MKIFFSLIISAAIACLGTPLSAQTITVRAGDTLGKLAAQHKTTVQSLVEVNNLKNPNQIRIGQKLEVEETLGASVPTVVATYSDALASRIASSATSFTLVRGTDRQSRSLNGFYGFVIDEGTPSEEFVTANCVATACTIVGRGLDVIDGETQITSLKSEHRRGAIVKISNFPQLAILSRILNGQESASSTFMIGDGSTTTTLNKYFKIDNGTSNLPFIRYNESLARWQFSDDGVSTISFTTSSAAGLSASSTRGIFIVDSAIGVNVSSTRGFTFDSDGKVGLNATTTQGLTFGTGGDLQFDPTRNFNFTGSVTATNLSVPYSTASSSAISYGVLQDKLFGNGSDGAFSLSSGNYQVLNTAGKYVYQYTSFSLTGNSALATGSNLSGHPLTILVQGDLTITSASTTAISRAGGGSAGAAGGAGGAASTNSGTIGTAPDFSGTAMKATAPTAGAGGVFNTIGRAGGGGGGGAGFGNAGANGSASGGGGAAGVGAAKEAYLSSASIARFISLCHMGGGGAGGGGGSSNGGVGGTGGTGGAGGGCLQFIVGGNINVTSTISVVGAAGSAGAAAGSGGGGSAGGGGGGGGGGGSIAIFYAGTAIANTGTYTVTGGAGGAGGAGNGTGEAGPAGGAGGDGQSVVRKISSFIGL